MKIWSTPLMMTLLNFLRKPVLKKKAINDQGMRDGSLHASLIILTAIVLTAVRLWLANSTLLTSRAGDIFDEALFLRQAFEISSGHWLGNFNQLTLFKGPFYPIFLSLAFFTGIRILLVQQVFYILACIVCILSLKPLLRSSGAMLCLYAILLFNPAIMASYGFTRLLREGAYTPLTLLVFAGLAGLLFRNRSSLRKQLPWSILLGFSYLAFYLTREERIWLTPTLIMGFLFYAGAVWKNNHRITSLIIIPVIPFVMVITGVLGIKLVNAHYYGAFIVTEYNDANFTDAYGSLLRVKPTVWRPMIPVARETRERIYAVSPAFAELSAYLEGPPGISWQQAGESDKKAPDEIGGGWFIWAFREAVASRGYYDSIDHAREYYSRLSREINEACDNGLLDCGPVHRWVNPVWNSGYIKPLISSFLEGISNTFSFTKMAVNGLGCSGSLENVRFFEAFTGDQCSAEYPRLMLSGWAFSEHGGIEIKIAEDGEIIQTTSLLESPDVFDLIAAQGESIEAARTARFSTDFTCKTDCTVIFLQEGQIVKTLDATRSISGDISDPTIGFHGHIDRLAPTNRDIRYFPEQYRLWQLKTWLISWLIRIYRFCFSVIGIVSMVLFIIGILLFLRSRTGIEYMVINGMLLAALISRWAVLSYFQSSSAYSMNSIYLSPIYALVIIFCFLNLRQFIAMIGHTHGSS